MKKLKNMMGHIEDLLSAISFAEEGDFKTAQTIMKEQRRVLLGLRGSRVDSATLKYALNTCKRVNAGLDVLHIAAEGAPPVLEEFLSRAAAEGISARVVSAAGCLKQAIINHTKANRDILFVVIESSDTLDAGCGGSEKRLSDAWKNLRCPLVVVSDAARA